MEIISIKISLKRGTKIYEFTLDDLLVPNGPDIYLQPNDRIKQLNFALQRKQSFYFGWGIAPNF